MPDPQDYDDEDDFISDCIDERQSENPDEDTDQSYAICQNIWDERSKSMKNEINSHDRHAEGVIHKTHVTKADGAVSDGPIEFVLSDATPDRYGDVIDPEGWVLDNFKKNPIALFNHRSDFPIGRWENLKIGDKGLVGNLRMAPEGTSERIDELRALINAGILRAVSVGFMPLESKSIKNGAGQYIGEEYLKQELIETSLVSVPANPNAVQLAKSMKISTNTMDVVFGKHVIETTIDRAVDGDTISWQGKTIPIKRHLRGSWNGLKLYSLD